MQIMITVKEMEKAYFSTDICTAKTIWVGGLGWNAGDMLHAVDGIPLHRRDDKNEAIYKIY